MAQLLENALGFFSGKSPGDRLDAGAFLFGTFNQFADLREGYLAGGASERTEFLRATCAHMVKVMDHSANLLSTLADTEVSLTIKVLAPSPSIVEASPPVVHTLMRNSLSRRDREFYDPLNDFPYHLNTAFRQIAHNSARSPIFHSDHLLRDCKRGLYDNVNDYWKGLYGKAAVVAIPAAGFSNHGLCGFLCADARTGSLKRTFRALETISSHVYHVFGLALSADEAVRGAFHFADLPEGSTGHDPAQAIMTLCSWKYERKTLIPNDAESQTRFQSLIREIESIYKADFPLNTGALFELPVTKGTQAVRFQDGGSEMAETKTKTLSEFVRPGDTPSDDIWRRLDQRKPLDTERDERILRRVASYDSYADKILAGLKKRRA